MDPFSPAAMEARAVVGKKAPNELKALQINLQPGANPFWFAVTDGLHPLRPEERLFQSTRCILSQVLVERDHESRKVWTTGRQDVNEDFFSNSVSVFEYYGGLSAANVKLADDDAIRANAENLRDFHNRDFDKDFLLDPTTFPSISDRNKRIGMGQQFNRMSAALGSSQPADASVNDKDWGWLEGVDLDAYITGAQAGGGGGSSPSGAPRPEAGAAAAAGPSSSSSPPDGGTSGPSSSSKLKDIGEFLQAKLQLRKDARQDLMSQVGVFSYLRVQIVNKLRPRQTFETYISLRAILCDPSKWIKGVWLDLMPPNTGLDPSVIHNISLQRGKFQTKTPKIKVCAGVGLSDAHIHSLLDGEHGPTWADVMREGLQETAHQLCLAQSKLAANGLDLYKGAEGRFVRRTKVDAVGLHRMYTEKEEWRSHVLDLSEMLDNLRRQVLQREQDVRDYFHVREGTTIETAVRGDTKDTAVLGGLDRGGTEDQKGSAGEGEESDEGEEGAGSGLGLGLDETIFAGFESSFAPAPGARRGKQRKKGMSKVEQRMLARPMAVSDGAEAT